ncbi:hypothetical protein PROFUN_08793 [Planoprotostelium fungivorum]|uniref:Uncharacterized protein n=1 Tax=Planoprotostelium fungivorum TaxID=1890364 RepID=A0A2P6MVS1_9EUKA|nr:hypothetical protein PROFUN_08793 [Planoprotostelium fungivorum]
MGTFLDNKVPGTNLTGLQFVIGGGVILAGYRIRSARSRAKNIPRKVMPFLRPGDLSTGQRNYIINELARSDETHIEPQLNVADHMGFGRDEEDQKVMHFKTTIATSIWVLEKAVAHLNPILRQRPVLTVRELFLQDNNPKLDRELCRYYIETYERARFSKDEFSLGEYQTFVTRFQTILNAFVVASRRRGEEPINMSDLEKRVSHTEEDKVSCKQLSASGGVDRTDMEMKNVTSPHSEDVVGGGDIREVNIKLRKMMRDTQQKRARGEETKRMEE